VRPLGLLFTAFALGGLFAGVALAALPPERGGLELPQAVALEGREAPRDALDEFLKTLAERVAEREAFVAFPEGTLSVRFSELGISLDVPATERALRTGTPRATLFHTLSRRLKEQSQIAEVNAVYAFDQDAARDILSRLAPGLRREPTNARLDLTAHRKVEDQPGRELDIGETIAAIAVGERLDTAVFEARFIPIQAAVTADALTSVDVTRVLSSFDTDFSKKPRSRIPNIHTAVQYLNGVVLGPNEVLSFNGSVGPRTYERGFREAPVIVQDELEPGLGGGVCQVATALFASAVLGGFEIVQRRSHSRPSGYAPLGLDATVIWDEMDLKVKNPYPSPVIVHAFFPSEMVLRVELLGRDPPGEIRHHLTVHEKHPFYRRVVVKPDLSPDKIDRRQKGNPGYDVSSIVRTTFADGTTKSRTYSSKYYPVPEVYWIGTAVDPESLPPLPEGATHVDLADAQSTADSAFERNEAERPN
jgi:vancomycin resistance protein YoaR